MQGIAWLFVNTNGTSIGHVLLWRAAHSTSKRFILSFVLVPHVCLLCSVGYGDFFAPSVCSRVVVLITAIFGITLFSGLFSAFAGFLVVPPKERSLINFTEKFFITQSKKWWAAICIQRCFRLFIVRYWVILFAYNHC
jgi:hypothetical protein